MRLGATLAHLAPGPPIAIAEWAKRLAGEGFESLWTPQVIGRGILVPDPFVSLAAATTATEHVEVGTATLQVPLHHPADLAHRILSLMTVCGDRLTLGLSPGSDETDYAVFDRDHSARFRTFDENLPRLRHLLAHGRDSDADLAPAGGTPPVLLGSWGAKVERAAREFDGWLVSAHRRSTDQIIAAHERYRAAGGTRAIVCAVPLSGPGDLGPTGEVLQRYAEAGFDDAVVLIGPDGPAPAQVRALFP
ncbi:LLM class flavin-dependent oxidoreductase [Sciscionella marina]|uniref:LLM class flavin-dependent oxidoreductase n=1 Tax=Sciscionella marina TaxID=508770 RepID=UPI0003812943|nr:LLM class flavin-dependent oxidoreductase [Sciscionella marina]